MRWGSESLEYTCDALNGLTEFYINSDLTETYSFDSQGRLENKGGHGYTYGDGDHVHAATAMGNNSYIYDENGNMIVRDIQSGPITGIYTLSHNAENRLVGVTGPDSTTTYTYNGDLAQVIAIMEGSQFVTKTIYIGSYYEYQIVATLTSTVAMTRTYYFAGSTRVAMRDNGTLIFLLSDHLGSTSLTTDASGGVLSVQKYMPYGEPRGTGGLETDYTFTGQRTAAAALMYYNARFYDPAISHFIEADTIIPEAAQGVMAWNRYAYVNYSAVNYADPSGHSIKCNVCAKLHQLHVNVMQQIGRKFVYGDDKRAEGVFELMAMALFQEPSAEIAGKALEDIANDKTLLNLQNGIADGLKSSPAYKQEDFSTEVAHKQFTFGEMGNNNMFEDALQSQTWTVRAADINYSVNVSKDGDIQFNYYLYDVFNLRPEWSEKRGGLSGFGYNIVTTVTGAVWHDLLGATEMNTSASWMYEIEAEE